MLVLSSRTVERGMLANGSQMDTLHYAVTRMWFSISGDYRLAGRISVCCSGDVQKRTTQQCHRLLLEMFAFTELNCSWLQRVLADELNDWPWNVRKIPANAFVLVLSQELAFLLLGRFQWSSSRWQTCPVAFQHYPEEEAGDEPHWQANMKQSQEAPLTRCKSCNKMLGFLVRYVQIWPHEAKTAGQILGFVSEKPTFVWITTKTQIQCWANA